MYFSYFPILFIYLIIDILCPLYLTDVILNVLNQLFVL